MPTLNLEQWRLDRSPQELKKLREQYIEVRTEIHNLQQQMSEFLEECEKKKEKELEKIRKLEDKRKSLDKLINPKKK